MFIMRSVFLLKLVNTHYVIKSLITLLRDIGSERVHLSFIYLLIF